MMLSGPSSVVAVRETILIFSRSEPFAESIKRTFDTNGYQSTSVLTLGAAISTAKESGAALIIIDRQVGDPHTIRQIRDVSAAPIIAVQDAVDTCTDDECLRDYERDIDLVVCTGSPRELLARARAILRRRIPRSKSHHSYQVGKVKMDVDRHEVSVGGRMVELTPKEFQILQQFLESPNRLFSRQEMLNKVWGEGYALEEHALDVHIHSLRQKIESDPAHPKLIVTVRGIGYKLRG
ncbi:MAG: response regulator transcription factor [Nitrospira sp.]|nr:response regulator transcription factor [Nitrospira sp.]MCP9443019.1 response regulator transcription factor [Nitrospira sp.]